MSRPKPTILLEEISDDVRAYQVCEADAVYAVCYLGKPIKIRTYQNIEVEYPGPKYAKTSFPTSGHAFRLAKRLNEKFSCEDFSVVVLVPGRVIS